jgi:xylulokinase
MPSGEIAGCVTKDIAQKLSLSERTIVVAGGHDQPCSALGAGITNEGMAVYATGTVECITPVFSQPVFSDLLKNSNLCTYDHTVEGMYTTVAFNLTGGNILKWFRNEFGDIEARIAETTDRDVYDLLLKQIPDEPTGLLVLPYFTSSGTPYFDTNAKGAIIGLELTTSKGEIIKALMEGVAYEMRLNLEILEESGFKINEIRVIGGGAKSEVWTQLKADILGKPITVPKVTEAGCMGAAILAKAAHAKEKVVNIASDWVEASMKIYPQKHKEYDQKYDQYKKLYPTLKGNFF